MASSFHLLFIVLALVAPSPGFALRTDRELRATSTKRDRDLWNPLLKPHKDKFAAIVKATANRKVQTARTLRFEQRTALETMYSDVRTIMAESGVKCKIVWEFLNWATWSVAFRVGGKTGSAPWGGFCLSGRRPRATGKFRPSHPDDLDEGMKFDVLLTQTNLTDSELQELFDEAVAQVDDFLDSHRQNLAQHEQQTLSAYREFLTSEVYPNPDRTVYDGYFDAPAYHPSKMTIFPAKGRFVYVKLPQSIVRNGNNPNQIYKGLPQYRLDFICEDY